MEKKVIFFEDVLQKIQQCLDKINKFLENDQKKTLEAQVDKLLKDPDVQKFFQLEKNPLKNLFENLSLEEKKCVLSLLFLKQGPYVFNPNLIQELVKKDLDPLLLQLREIETFYFSLGGIIGYHQKVLQEILLKTDPKKESFVKTQFLHPVGVDFEKEKKAKKEAGHNGIKYLPEMGEIYAVGGSGDRLDLKDKKTGQALPAAMLPFLGITLIEGLIRDLQAKEDLYFKLTGNKISVPIALMTSEEKENDHYIQKIFKDRNWFGRPKDSVFFFKQPLAPVITEEGNWAISAPLKLVRKPGGHGVIWKLAKEFGVFDWFLKKGKKKLLIRQINNPIAGIDDGIIAFCGIGSYKDKQFGFFSCPRLVNSSEGSLVIEEKKEDEKYRYTLSNIEYTHFKEKKIEDKPIDPKKPYSIFPTNTNILFADIVALSSLVERNPFPGLLINMKHKASFIDENGNKKEVLAGRLETMMQNISDEIHTLSKNPLTEEELENLPAFIAFNERQKTISVTKKQYKKEESLSETPEGAFRDLLVVTRKFFEIDCGFSIPKLEKEEDWIQKGPSSQILFHPALGPNFSIIRQKIRKGNLEKNAELVLNLSELDVHSLSVKGSFQIHAEDPFSTGGKCCLKNVEIRNKGIDFQKENYFWERKIHYLEKCEIFIEGTGEFFAENVTLEGSFEIYVPNGYRVTAKQEEESIFFIKEKIDESTWFWQYSFDQENNIFLEKKSLIKNAFAK